MWAASRGCRLLAVAAPRRSHFLSTTTVNRHAFPNTAEIINLSEERLLPIKSTMFDMLRQEAVGWKGPILDSFLHKYVLHHTCLESSLARILASKICHCESNDYMHQTFVELLHQPEVMRSVLADLVRITRVDPAAEGILQPFLFFKGFHSLVIYRMAHILWSSISPSEKAVALLLQNRASELFGVDIHPGADLGAGIVLDHATGIVVGSTAILGNDIYMLHSCTIGATGKPVVGARRHPKIGDRVGLGAGCAVIGSITIGNDVQVGAGALVTRAVSAGLTVVGTNQLLMER